MYKGTTRQRTLDVYIDGTLARTWESSGTTDDFETIDLTGNDRQLLIPQAVGQVLELSGYRDPSEWISIVEVSGVRMKRSSLLFISSDPVSLMLLEPPTCLV